MITIDDVLAESNLKAAMDNLAGKKDSCGVDNIHVSEFPAFWEINGDVITDKIRNGIYEPELVLEREIVGYNGKRRKISQLTCTDRLILRAVYQIIDPACEAFLSDISHAYRNDRGTETAVHMATDYIMQGDVWVAEIDIEHFFDNVPLDRMEEVIRDLLQPDEILLELLKKYLHCKIEQGGKISSKKAGIIQGSPISPALSNLYLSSLDSKMIEAYFHAVHFADDINVYAGTYEKALDAMQKVTEWLTDLGLRINSDKSGIFHAANRRYLGYFLEQKPDGTILATKKKKDKTQYQNWHYSALQRVDRNYHLVNNGILTKKDFSLLFENDEKKMYLPVETTDSINVYSDVIFSSGLFSYLAGRRLRIAVFDKYGRSIGSFLSDRYSGGGKTILKQAALYLDENERLQMAKKLDMAAMHNLRANLRYYKKQKCDTTLDDAIRVLSETISKMNESVSIEDLMLVEARGRQAYYQAFNAIITNPNFRFTQRTKRPPRDPLNALISFGNVYMYNRIATEIHKTSLDIRIGILHSTNNRAESLNLDIAEIFKPVIVDRAIFTLINKKMLHAKEHFETTDNGGIYLNPEGKRIFLDELGSKLYQTVQVKQEKRTYDYLIREEVQKILRKVLYDDDYKPYKYTN